MNEFNLDDLIDDILEEEEMKKYQALYGGLDIEELELLEVLADGDL